MKSPCPKPFFDYSSGIAMILYSWIIEALLVERFMVEIILIELPPMRASSHILCRSLVIQIIIDEPHANHLKMTCYHMETSCTFGPLGEPLEATYFYIRPNFGGIAPLF